MSRYLLVDSERQALPLPFHFLHNDLIVRQHHHQQSGVWRQRSLEITVPDVGRVYSVQALA